MARKKETSASPFVPAEEQPYRIPDNWCWVYALSLFNIEYGKGLPTKQLTEKGYPVFGANGQIGFYHSYMFDDSKALMSCRGAYSGTMNLSLPKSFITNNSLVIDCKDSSIIAKFIYYLFEGLNKEPLISGTAQPQVTVQAFASYPVPLPPSAEQRRIVDRIESLFAKLDEAKEKAQAVVDGFELRKSAILHKAFTGELTAQWRKKHPSSPNTLLSDIEKFSHSWHKKDQQFLKDAQSSSKVVALDNGHTWIKCTIGAVSRVTNGSTPSRKVSEYWDGTIPWVSSGEVRNNTIENTNECITQEGYDNSSVKLLPTGTVLIAMIGEGKTRGQSAILAIDATINQNIAAVVVDHGLVISRYIWYWFQMNYSKNREKGAGSGPQALNCQRVRELDFYVPNMPEQIEIVCTLDKLLGQEVQAKEAAEAVLDQIDTMKKAILARAFRGELGTNAPAEEWAGELVKESFSA